MSLLGSYRATNHTEFRYRVHSAVLITAAGVLADTSLPSGSPRQAAAAGTLMAPAALDLVNRFVWRVANDPTIAATISEPDGGSTATDAQIVAAVHDAWDAIYPV